MPNRMYANSTRRELLIKREFEEKGWYSIRASGSHGIADVIAIRPVKNCTNPSHFEVKFIQVKTSQAIKEAKIIPTAAEAPFGPMNVEFHYFPVKNDKFRAAARKRKEKLKAKLKKAKK